MTDRHEMRIYLASSWRNDLQPVVLEELRAQGYDVYDFRCPESHFRWGEIDPAWRLWTPEQFVAACKDPRAEHGYGSDMAALRAAHACVFLEPCGKSASLELGYAAGAGKFTVAIVNGIREPELMLKMCDAIVVGLGSALIELDNFWRERFAPAVRSGR